jgi:hypothetical protein
MSTLTLADVVSRATPVSWYEGVAITQALCEALPGGGTDDPVLVSDLGAIRISKDGRLEIPDDISQGQPPVQGAGRVLLALVPEHQMPVQLRLLALTAVSPTPSYRSVDELSSALDYFARPDRSAQVRAVYERCLALPITSEPVAVPLMPLTAAAATRPAAPARRKGQPWTLTVALLVVAMAGAGAVWLAGKWFGGSNPAIHNGVGAAMSGAAGRAGNLAAGAVTAVSRQLGLAPEVTPVVRIGHDISLPASGGVGGRGRSGRSAREPLIADLPSVGWVGIPSITRVDETVMATIGEPDGGIDPLPADPSDRYYTAADDGVAPPALLRPRLPQLPPMGVRLTQLPHVDLLVSESGEVEWVRLWPADVGVHAAMMLSAIKNWRFEPARIGGRAVRYRQTIALTSR